MVSLRMGELRLLALRGRFAVGRRTLADVRLVRGQKIALTGETTLEVMDVVLPRELLAVEGDGLERQVLPGVCGLVTEPAPALVSPLPENAVTSFWHNGSGWRMRPRGETARPLLVGDSWRCGELTFRAVAWELTSSSDGATMVDGGLERPLRIQAWYDTVHLQQGADEPVVLSGVRARLVSELVAFGGPAEWRVLAQEIWGAGEETSLRRRLDVCANRLRTRLRELGIRPDLVVATGTGHYELLLHERDVVEDHT